MASIYIIVYLAYYPTHTLCIKLTKVILHVLSHYSNYVPKMVSTQIKWHSSSSKIVLVYTMTNINEEIELCNEVTAFQIPLMAQKALITIAS